MRGEPRAQGSFAGGVHRKLMELEAATAEHIDHTLLAEIERGEDFAVMAYRDALQTRDLEERTRKLIQQQYEGVQAAHDRVRQLRDRAAYVSR